MSKPDWKFWLSQKTVELWQAAYLTCGIDPDDDNYRDIEHYGIHDEKVGKRVRTLRNHIGDMNVERQLSEFSRLGLSLGWDMPPKLIALAKEAVAAARTEMNGVPPTQESPKAKSRVKLLDQEKAILKTLKEHGHDAKALPKIESGKSGVKATIRDALKNDPLFSGATTFNKAWDRLRTRKEISNASA